MTHVNGGRSLSEDEGGHQARPHNVMGGRKLSHPSDRQDWAQKSLTSQTVLNPDGGTVYYSIYFTIIMYVSRCAS